MEAQSPILERGIGLFCAFRHKMRGPPAEHKRLTDSNPTDVRGALILRRGRAGVNRGFSQTHHPLQHPPYPRLGVLIPAATLVAG